MFFLRKRADPLNVPKVGQITIAIDGTKVMANARAHARDALAKAEYEKKVAHRKAQKGREKYKLRQQTVEPVFGIIKSVPEFRRFMLRGLEQVKLEWTLVSTAYNLKRLHRRMGAV